MKADSPERGSFYNAAAQVSAIEAVAAAVERLAQAVENLAGQGRAGQGVKIIWLVRGSNWRRFHVHRCLECRRSFADTEPGCWTDNRSDEYPPAGHAVHADGVCAFRSPSPPAARARQAGLAGSGPVARRCPTGGAARLSPAAP